jgi:cytochrome c peroxidase
MEQALPDSACVVYRVCNAADYPVTIEQVWGVTACNIAWPADVDTACAQEGATVDLSADDRARVDASYDSVALSIAAFEASRESNAFTAKYDYVLGGKAKLSQLERRGFALFHGRAKCFRCHTVTGKKPLLTDFTFDNLGLPRNPDNPWYNSPANPDGVDWVDAGLGGFLASRDDYALFAEENRGKHKVPTLRNVAKAPSDAFVKAFGHNGYFKSLKGIIHFYNTRDVKPRCADRFTTEAVALQLGCWPEPEVVENVNRDELGDLGLSSDDEDALVEFLKTLSDGYQP